MRSGVIKSIIKFFGVYWIWSPSPSVIWSSLDAQRMNLYSLNQSIQLLVSINTLKSVLFANCCSNWSIFYDNRNESQSEGKVVPCITYNVWDTRSLTFRHKNTSYDLLLPTWSVHYLFSLLWIPTKPRRFHLLLDKNPTKQRIIVDIWFRGRSLSQPPAQNEVTSKISPQLLPINTINGFHRIVPRILQRQVTYP